MSGFDIKTVKMDARHEGLRTDPPREKGGKPWEHNLYTVTLTNTADARRKPFVTEYRMGIGCKGAPKLAEVLQCLQSDASDIHAGYTFEEWADSLEYNSDSIKDRDVYLACQKTYSALKMLFGIEGFAAFMDFDFDEMRPRSVEAECAAEVAK